MYSQFTVPGDVAQPLDGGSGLGREETARTSGEIDSLENTGKFAEGGVVCVCTAKEAGIGGKDIGCGEIRTLEDNNLVLVKLLGNECGELLDCRICVGNYQYMFHQDSLALPSPDCQRSLAAEGSFTPFPGPANRILTHCSYDSHTVGL